MAQTKKAECKCCQTETEHVEIPAIVSGKRFWECTRCLTVTHEPRQG